MHTSDNFTKKYGKHTFFGYETVFIPLAPFASSVSLRPANQKRLSISNLIFFC